MRSNLFGKLVLVTVLAAPGALLLNGCGGNDNVNPSSASGYVYVETNDVSPNQNAIVEFQRQAGGGLNFVGSFLSSGTGAHEPALAASGTLDIDRELITNPQHTLLWAVNQGSNTVAVFSINAANGALTQVPGSPFSSGGTAPVSLTLANNNNTLVIINSGLQPTNAPGASNIVSYNIGANGLPSSSTPASNISLASGDPVSFSNGTTPSIAAPSPDGSLIFDADFHGGALRSFQVTSSGQLVQTGSSPLNFGMSASAIYSGANANTPPLPLGLAVYPSTSQRLIYVSAILADAIAVYSYDAQGNLTFVKGVPNQSHDSCWIRVTPNGRWMYTSNALSDDISIFSLADPTTPVQTGSANVTPPLVSGETDYQVDAAGGNLDQVNGNPWQEDIDPSGTYLYDLTPRDLIESGHSASDAIDTPAPGAGNTIDQLHAFRINADGSLTQLGSYPLGSGEPADGSQPQGVLAI